MQLFGGGPSNQRRRTRYRSARSVQRAPDVPTHLVTRWTNSKIALVTIGALVLGTTTILPIIILEQTTTDPNNFKAPVSIHDLLSKSADLEVEFKHKGIELLKKAKGALHVHLPEGQIHPEELQNSYLGKRSGTEDTRKNDLDLEADSQLEDEEHPRHRQKPKQDIDQIEITKAQPKHPIEEKQPTKQKHPIEEKLTSESKPLIAEKQPTQHSTQLARGVSGLPLSQTPSLIGAKPGHIDCDVNIDDIVYWNDPQGRRDQDFVSPFATPFSTESSSQKYYLTFEPDPGGWNNIRMSMEIIFVLAAVTGRVLVLPPKAPFYLLGTGAQNARSFGSFFPLDHPQFAKRVEVITMPEFIEREGSRLLELSESDVESIKPVAEMCLHNQDSDISCEKLYPHLREVGHQPPMNAQFQDCLVFDEDYFKGNDISEDAEQRIKRFCGERKIHYYDKEMHEPQLLHWDASNHDFRLLNHFYAFLYFTNPAIDNFYKRFVRDFLHYKDQIYCAAGKIVHALNAEGREWSSLHIRRGDFQYKKVKLPAEEWYENTKEVWHKGEILFIATDERNKTFFDPLKEHHDLRFLDDYWDMARLGDLDKNFLGMIDTIVASHGRAFAGTWFSTFTGYINRMRGYIGHSMTNSWYSFLERKDAMQEWRFPEPNYPAREWPIGWVAIDGDEVIEHEGEPVMEQISQNIEVAASDASKRMVGAYFV